MESHSDIDAIVSSLTIEEKVPELYSGRDPLSY